MAPTLNVHVRGGATLIDTATDLKTCNLADLVIPANAPITTNLIFSVNQTSALAELVDENLEPITTAVVEVTIAGALLPRLVITGAELDDAGKTITVALADRRYEDSRRYVGRTGAGAALVPEFYDPTPGTIPGGWTQNPGAPDTLTIGPAGTGIFGTTAEEITADGPGPMNCYSAGWIGDTVTFDRNVGFGAAVFLPSGAWAPNRDGQLIEIIAYDTDQVDDNGDNLVVAVAVADVTVSDVWTIVAGHVRIPAGKTYNIELRLFAPDGTVRYQLAGLAVQEALSWSNVDAADIILDLVAHANDNTWGHSDTGIRADTTSIPDTGLITSRLIRSSEKHQIFDVIAEMTAAAGAWQHLTPEDDGTDTLHINPGGDTSSIDATDANCDFGGWQWQGNDHADVLGMFAPDGAADITGDRLIMWAADGAVITDLGTSHDFGRELYLAGPFGNYDPRTVAGLILPFAAAKKSALVARVKFKPNPDILDEALTGNLRPGGHLNATVGRWPRGVDDTFLVTSVTLAGGSFAVEVELNRIPGGA